MTGPLPFTRPEFLGIFERYNEALWPAEVVAYMLAFVAAAALFHRAERVQRAARGALATLWIWTGIVYHWIFFAEVNPAAWLFGLLFVLEGIWIAIGGASRERLRFRLRGDPGDVLGGTLLAYAAILYPAAATLGGDVWPATPGFGITPCPLTMFTLGMLLFARPGPSLWAIPLLWALIGGSASLLLGIMADWPLLLAGPATLMFLWRQGSTGRAQAERVRDSDIR
jgi:hypothetical protein